MSNRDTGLFVKTETVSVSFAVGGVSERELGILDLQYFI